MRLVTYLPLGTSQQSVAAVAIPVLIGPFAASKVSLEGHTKSVRQI